jgi:hypothetical protein
MGGGQSISFNVVGDGYTEDDPGLSFLTSSPLFSTASIAGATGLYIYGGTIHGHYIALVVVANKNGGTTMSATVSIDLVLRSPDDIG